MLINEIIARIQSGDAITIAKAPNADGTRDAMWRNGGTVTLDADTAYEVFLLGLPDMLASILDESEVTS